MADLQDILSTIPIFSFLGRTELAAVQELFVESTHQKGDVICREGEEGDTFHVILDGELEVLAGEGEKARLLAILKRGDFFGEMALLQGGKRTAGVIASRRVRLMTLDRTAFNSLFLKNPKALEYFTRVLCKRLASTSKADVARGSTMAISVGAVRPGLKGVTLVAAGLAGILHDLTNAEVLLIRVRPGTEPTTGPIARLLSDSLRGEAENIDLAVKAEGGGISTLHIPTAPGEPAGYYNERASNLISNLTDRFPFMVFDLGAEPRGLIEAVPMFSDVYIEIADRVEDTNAASKEAKGRVVKKYRVINLFNPGSQSYPISSCEPFVIPRDFSLSNGHATESIRKNLRSPAALPLQRLARKIIGASVGIALGGGAAFGMAHLGVLQVLEKHGVAIDLVAGCSQGSIIGIGYSAGISVDEMIEIAMRLGQKKNSLLAVDLTVTRPGIMAGDRFIRIFAPLLGTKMTFDDLLMPCRTVCTDVESGERVSIGDGSLSQAFRASASLPMVFAPVKIGEHVLVDGGVSDPVPAEVVNQMGADLCIAVNVVPPLKRGVENAVSKAMRQLNRFNPMSYIGDAAGLPNMFDIIMNSMQILQYELGNFKAISADVLINPELSDFTWVEYYRSEELIARGVEAAERSMPAINRAYGQKIAQYRKRST